MAVQSFLAYWFHARFAVGVETLGWIFLAANLVAAASALAASRLARQFGYVNTMVFTHLPSNVLLMLVPLCPTLPLAITVLLLRFSISQMDVPTRQALVTASVDADERAAAGGVTAIARSVGASLSPAVAGPLFASAALLNLPIYLSGGFKIVYDLLLYGSFRHLGRLGVAPPANPNRRPRHR
jgi:predicted MFS family arabinose efflux permease